MRAMGLINMCELHFIYPLNRNVNKKDLSELVSMLLDASSFNMDGFGVTNGNTIFRRGCRYVMQYDKPIFNLFNSSRFVVAHNRYTTAGAVKKTNSHPFFNKRFIWMHNGHISNYSLLSEKYGFKNINVDSQIIGELLFRRCKNKTNILPDLKKTLEELTGGFSVFLYDKKTGNLYYFKHGQSFQFRLLTSKNDSIIVGCTDSYKLDYLYLFAESKKFGFKELNYKVDSYLTPIDNTIYEIKKSGLNVVGCFDVVKYVEKPKKYTYGKYNKTDFYDNEYYSSFEYDLSKWCLDDLERLLSKCFSEEITIAPIKVKSGKKLVKLYKIICSDSILEVIKDEFRLNVLNPIDKNMLYGLCRTLLNDEYRYLGFDAFEY